MMGVGKSTLGKIVAKELDLKFIDTDSNIEKKLGMSVSQIFMEKGESYFRLNEEKEVIEALREARSIIALGGGAFINKIVREKVLKDSISIWLDVNLNTLNRRIKWNKKRPLLNKDNTKKKIDELYMRRKNIYKHAKYKINCNSLSKKAIVKKIINFYEKQ